MDRAESGVLESTLETHHGSVGHGTPTAALHRYPLRRSIGCKKKRATCQTSVCLQLLKGCKICFLLSVLECKDAMFLVVSTGVQGRQGQVCGYEVPGNNTTQPNPTQHNTTQHNTTQHNTTQHNTTQHNTTQHNTTQHNTTQHNTTQHNTTQYNTIQYNTTQNDTTQHNRTQNNTTSVTTKISNSMWIARSMLYRCDELHDTCSK